MYSDFHVHTVTELIDRFMLVELVSDTCRAPDHSLVVVTVRLSPGDILLEPNNTGNSAHSPMNAERTAVLNVNKATQKI